MRKALKWGAWIAVALAVSGLAVFAQQGGGLQGKVTDEAGQPVIGATIQVSGPSLQGFQGTATDVNGQYVIPFLPVGKNYQVKVEAPGYNSVVRKGIEIPLGTTISLPFTLSQGKTEIVVTAAAPVIDTKKTEVGANISDTMISSIPLSRNSAGIAFLAPGAVSSGLADTPSIAGASGPENSYTVNGVDVTGSGDALNLTSLNFDFIEATEVKTGGLDAEYGALMGGNINSITKSGGNEFHGSLFVYYFDDNMGAQERKLRNPTIVNFRKAFKQYDIGGSLGGYFIKDKLWFFVAYDWNKTEQTFTANGGDENVWLNGHPSYSWAAPTGYKNTDKDPQYALKLTWNVNPNHKLSLSWFGNNDKYDYFANLANFNPTASPRKSKTDNYAVSLQWNATWTPKFFTEAVIARRHTKDSNHPVNAAAESNYSYYYRFGSGTYAGYQVRPDVSTQANLGQAGLDWDLMGLGGALNPANWYVYYDYGTRKLMAPAVPLNLLNYGPSLGGRTRQDTKDINDQIRLKATHLFDFHGRHELAYGFQYYDITYDYNFNYTGAPFTDGVPTSPFFNRTMPGGVLVRFDPRWWDFNNNGIVDAGDRMKMYYRAQGFMNDQNKKTSQKYYAYWAQDNWNLTDYFLLKVGVRLDQIHMKGGDNTVNVPAVILHDPSYSNGKARKVNINDMWAPRIGFTWDVAHNGKSKLYGFWGYYYERIPNDMAIRALTDEYFHFTTYYNPDLTIPQAWSGTNGFKPTKIVGGPNGGNLKGSYNKETILGYQYEIRPDFSMGARAIYRSIGRVIEDISVDGATSYIVTNPDKWTGVWAPDPLGRPGYWWRFPKPVRIYKALEITADKRFSNHWMLQGSYTLSRLKGNYEGLFSNDNGQLDPNLTSKYDLPQLLVNAYGLLPNDRTHVLKVYGGYFFENIPLELSGSFTLQSGTPISKLGADDLYGVNEGFCQPRGTAGRTPTLWQLDLGAQYTFKLWKSNLALRADIFNVTNEQRTTTVDQTYNALNTENRQTYPYFKVERGHQTARRVRLAVRWTF